MNRTCSLPARRRELGDCDGVGEQPINIATDKAPIPMICFNFEMCDSRNAL